MAPKKATQEATDTMAADITAMSIKLTSLVEKMESMENLLKSTQKENSKLNDQVQNQAEEISYLKDRLNDREQYARSWSIRCLNMPLSKDKETDPRHVMHTVYKELLHPILTGAQENGDITTIPSCEELVEMAHILPARKEGNKPIILRFYSRYMRSLIFKHRKNFAPRDTRTPNSGTGTDKPPRMKYSFFEDLSRETYAKLSEIKGLPDVLSAWTVSGSIRFKTKNSDTVYKVKSLSDTYESLVE